MKNTIRDEKGIALITTLLLIVLGLGVVATLLCLVTYGTKLSGAEQRYGTALEASKGGTELLISMILNQQTSPPAMGVGAGESSPNPSCLDQKLSKITSSWLSPPCSANASNPNATLDPDLTLTLSNRAVSAKIIDTSETSTHFFYTINVKSQAPNSDEEAEISFLYRIEK